MRPDCVYVMPPNKDMSLLHEVLHLLPPVTAPGPHLPIDFFFRSLAQDHSLLKNPVRCSAVRDSRGTNRAHCWIASRMRAE